MVFFIKVEKKNIKELKMYYKFKKNYLVQFKYELKLTQSAKTTNNLLN